jgi:hypothetical protein
MPLTIGTVNERRRKKEPMKIRCESELARVSDRNARPERVEFTHGGGIKPHNHRPCFIEGLEHVDSKSVLGQQVVLQ